MEIKDLNHTAALLITGVPGLDPVKVATFHSVGPYQGGSVVIICYNRAWTAYFGNTGAETLEQFIVTSDEGYLLENLLWNQERLKRVQKTENAWLLQIIQVVKAALHQWLRNQAKPPACPHTNTAPRWNYLLCLDCGGIRMDGSNGVASNTWFKSHEHARFYKEHGRLPEGVK